MSIFCCWYISPQLWMRDAHIFQTRFHNNTSTLIPYAYKILLSMWSTGSFYHIMRSLLQVTCLRRSSPSPVSKGAPPALRQAHSIPASYFILLPLIHYCLKFRYLLICIPVLLSSPTLQGKHYKVRDFIWSFRWGTAGKQQTLAESRSLKVWLGWPLWTDCESESDTQILNPYYVRHRTRGFTHVCAYFNLQSNRTR